MGFRYDIEVLRRAAQASDKPGILDGRAVAAALRAEVSRGVALLKELGIVPRLDVVLVGDDPASQIYVRHKVRACEEVGIESHRHMLGRDVSASDLYGLLDSLSVDPSVYGVLLQLPVPVHLDTVTAIDRIASDRDVDGFHAVNLGRLMGGRGQLEPCTPRGVMSLLRAYDVDLQGKRAVVIGRSIGVGRPMAQMLVRANATVTVCHRHTRNLAEVVADAEVLVVATGVPELVKGDWIRDGAVVVDIGISRSKDGLVGDVEFAEAVKRTSLISPVPGGVGPMTVASLMENTLRAACARHHITIDADGLSRE